MRLLDLPLADQWNDLLQALDFAARRFEEWAKDGLLTQDHRFVLFRNGYAERRQKWSAARDLGQAVPEDTGLPKGHAGEAPALTLLRYWVFVEREIPTLAEKGLCSLAQSHALRTEVRERQAALERKLAPDELPEVVAVKAGEPRGAPPVGEAGPRLEALEPKAFPEVALAQPALPAAPRRALLDILLEPRNIQMLLAFGGALMVVGLVIWLWVNNVFTPAVVALGLGVLNAAVLIGGWWLLRNSRYPSVGRPLTLLACLVMPLNLWYYHANDLITLDGHLWVAALVISALYAASALVLRDELFVYIFVAGVTLTGLLLLADLPPSPQKFWEIASPATLLIVLGLLAIHAERAFPPREGPFGRRRFGLAFFWSGHAVLAAGLALRLGAQVAGDWLYRPVFEQLYQRLHATPSPIVGELRWLAWALVVAGTYAYLYSDLVVRHAGVFVHIAAGTLLWAVVLTLQLLHLAVGMDALIAVLAATGLVLNVAQATVLRDYRYTRAFPVLGLLLPLLAVALGLLVYFRALSLDLRSVWATAPPGWTYVGAMLLTAMSCRVGAHLYRSSQPRLSVVYLFTTAAATLVAATALLAALGLTTWQQHAPLLMLLPIAYLVGARLERGRPEEMPLVWVAQAATAVMLVSSLASAVQGFALVQQQALNLALALFFAEAAVFYALATVFQRQAWTVHLGAAMACGAVWQVLVYWGVAHEFYTLTFALVGLGLLVAYRLAIVERFAAAPLADAAFQSANTLLSLAFVAALLLGISRLAGHQIQWELVRLFAELTAISLLAVALVRHMDWRRWYVVTTVGQAALTFLGITVLSELSQWQKLEIFCVAIGLLLLAAGHVGWYREQERQSDLVTLGLLLGSLLVGVPLAIATLIDRWHDHFIVLNELGFLAASVVLVTTGFLFQLKTTTLVGAALTALYFVTLLIYVPLGRLTERLNTVALFIAIGGGLLFGTGLLLTAYRDRLLALPEKVKKREGLFRVLNWR